MRILFVTAHAHMPQMVGGSQSSTHELALHLAGKGHAVAVLSALWGQGWIGWRGRIQMKLLRRKVAHDTLLGYDCFRKWRVWEDVEAVTDRFSPDVAVVMAMNPVPSARALIAAGIPTAVYFRDVDFDKLGGDPRELDGAVFVANSEFTAARFAEAFGLDCVVVPPLFDPSRYRTERTEGGRVTFINPHPLKGSALAFAIAERCPQIPFQFVESWPLDETARAEIEARTRGTNVTFLRRTSDMKTIYAQTRILLAPSRWEEAWGRVATEAQFSGIPVVASDIGGLPEAVGPGGILVSPDAPADAWAAALTRLWEDRAYYADLSAAALRHSERAALDADTQAATLIAHFERAVAGGSALARAPVDRASGIASVQAGR